MGLTIVSYPVYNGLTSISDAYLNIRNIRTTKEVITETDNVSYTLEFEYNIQKNGTNIYLSIIRETKNTPYTGNPWDTAYTLIKADLTSKSLSFTDTL
jgi:hypothetical protein